MAELSADARIRDLRRRLELDPSSRLFVTLAEEYRKTGLLAEALSTLQKGLLAHPNYLSAHVALGRAYLEAGQITEAIATFTKVLTSDPGNLVSAKSLADIYFSRGESVEAIKKYKLYRALSGDRTVDDIIERLSVDLAPPPPPARSIETAALPPPPPFFNGRPTGPIRTSREISFGAKRADEIGESSDVRFVSFDPEDSVFRKPGGEAGSLPVSRDIPVGSSPFSAAEPATPPPSPAPAYEDPTTRALRATEVLRAEEPAPPPDAQGRTLADLYFAQGHYAEALAIYDDLVTANPFDPELKRLRRDAEARLLPAASAADGGAQDRGLARRLARVRALKQWLAVVQTG